MTYRKVDRKSPEIIRALSTAKIFKKRGRVKARLATVGEEVITIFKDGAQETANRATFGDWVITNPLGEQYIISGVKFLERYESTGEVGVYNAKGYCRAIRNPFCQPIEIMASWGQPQFGDENCWLADTCDTIGNMGGEPYIIEAAAFAETYEPVTYTED